MAISPYGAFIRRSFLGLVGLLLTAAALVFAISPRRDPAFVATSSNAGTLVSWAANIPENLWIQGSALLAVLLAINIVLLGRQRLALHQHHLAIVPRVVAALTASITAAAFAYLLWLGMVWYLLVQSIVD